MKKEIKLSFISNLEKSFASRESHIHVVIGPRQVGKTTGIQQFLKHQPSEEVHYASADGPLAKASSWLEEQWILLKSKGAANGFLVIDEIQKVENWSEMIKKL